MNQRTKRKLDDLQRIVKDYRKNRDKIGKKKVLQRVKIRLRTLPDNGIKVMTAFYLILKLNSGIMSDAETTRRIECLTDLSVFEIMTVLDMYEEKLVDAGIQTAATDGKFAEVRRKESIIDPEDAAINEYCEVELKRKYQSDLKDSMRAYS